MSYFTAAVTEDRAHFGFQFEGWDSDGEQPQQKAWLQEQGGENSWLKLQARKQSWNCDAFKCSQPAHDGTVARVRPPARPHLLISPNSMISWGPSIQKPKTVGTVLIQITTMDMYANWLPWSSHCIITHMILLNISYHKLYIHNHPLVPARYLSQDILWIQILIFLSLCVKWCSICT